MKRFFWTTLGFISLGMAYLGIITPGLPYSIFVVFAAYCFGKGSPAMHKWIYNHKLFGPFIKNWADGKVYPAKIKWIMFLCMDASLVIMWFATHNWKLVAGMSVFFALVLLWAYRYPTTKEESDRRKTAGERVGWLK